MFGDEDDGGRIEQARLTRRAAPTSFTASATVLPSVWSRGGCAVVGDSLMLFGGDDGNVSDAVVTSTVGLDGELGPFAVAAVTLTGGRKGVAAAVLGQSVAVMGGNSSNLNLACTRRETDVVVAASDVPGPVSAGPDLAVRREGAGAFATSTSLAVFGGRGGNGLGCDLNNALSSVEVATVSGGEPVAFADRGAGLTTSRRGPVSIALGDELLVLGGNYAGGVGSWERAPALPGAALGSFAVGGTLATARDDAMGLVVHGEVWLLGGLSGLGANTVSTTERAPITALGPGTFSADSLTLPGTSHALGCAVVLGDHLWLVGGEANGTPTADVWRAPLTTP